MFLTVKKICVDGFTETFDMENARIKNKISDVRL